MGIVSRLAAVIVMGLIAAIFAATPLAMISMTRTQRLGASSLSEILLWYILAIGVVAIIAVFAPSARIAWGRAALCNGLAALALPLAGVVFSLSVGSASPAPHTAAEQVGTAVGTGIATVAVVVPLAVIGFFSGLILLVIAHFALREPRTVRSIGSLRPETTS